MNANHKQKPPAQDLSVSFGMKGQQSPEVLARVSSLFGEDLAFVVKRLVTHDGLDEEFAKRIRPEFLRFVALRQQFDGTLVPSESIDKFWHAFILYTEEYTEFCERHLGGYMHHRPQDHFASTAAISIASRRTMEHLNEMFQDYDRSVWSKSAICCDPGDCGCP